MAPTGRNLYYLLLLVLMVSLELLDMPFYIQMKTVWQILA
jgi:hypothetical protein